MRGKKHTKRRHRRPGRGLGSPPDVHLSKANEHLYRADIALAAAKTAPTCAKRVQNALDAYEHSIAAGEHMISAGQAPMGQSIALQAATIIGTCVIREQTAAPRGTRRFKLIRGGRA